MFVWESECIYTVHELYTNNILVHAKSKYDFIYINIVSQTI